MKKLKKTSLSPDEHSGAKKLFSKYDPNLALAELELGIFTGVKAYLSPLTTWMNTWSSSKGLMKGLDEKMELSKLASDVVSAGASGMSAGTMGLGTNLLQQAFRSLGLGANAMAGGGTLTQFPTQGALEVRLTFLGEEVRSLKFRTKSVSIVGNRT